MKLVLKQRYEDEAFESVLVRATTKAERLALKILKYDLIDDRGFFNPALLGENLCIKYAKALGYDVPDNYDFDPDNEGLSWWEDDEDFPGYRYFNCIPSHIEVIEAYYKMMGKYRKVSRIHKELKRIEEIKHLRYERIYHDLSKKIDEAWEKEQEAV